MTAMRSLLALTASAPADCGCALIASTVDNEPGTSSATWSGVLGVEGQMTGDGRFIELNALYWDDLPLPLRYVAQDVGAHDGAQVVGRITRIWREDDGRIMGEGDFDSDSSHGQEAARQVANGLTTGVSMDLDDVSFEVRMSSELVSLMEAEGVAPDNAELADDDGRIKVASVKSDDEVRITTSGRIRAATIVAIPAFAEAKIALAAGGNMQTFGYNPSQARAPKGTSRGGQWIDTPGGIAAMSASLTPQGEHAGRTTQALNDSGLLNGGWENAGGPHSVRPYTDADGNRRLLYLQFDEGADEGSDSWYVNDVPEGDYGPDFSNPGNYTNPDTLENTISWIQENYPDVYSSHVQTFSDPTIEQQQQQPAEPGREPISIDVTPLLDQPPCPVEVTAAFNALNKTEEMEFGSEEYMACAQYARDLLAKAVDDGYEKAQVAVDALDTFLAVDWSMWQPEDEDAPDLAEPGLDEPLTASATAAFGYNPDQARVPKGQEKGGQWIDTPGGVATTGRELAEGWGATSKTTMNALNEVNFLGGGWFEGGGPNAGKEFTDSDGKKKLIYLRNDANAENEWYSEVYEVDDNGDPLFGSTDISAYGGLGQALDAIKKRVGKQGEMAGGVQSFADDQIDEKALLETPACPVEVTFAINLLNRTQDTEFLSDEYLSLAERARDFMQAAVDKGFEPAQELADKLDAFLAVNWTDLTDEDLKMPEDTEMEQAPDSSLMASAAKDFPPREWFRDPRLKEPTALTVTDDGRVYGHLAVWDTCHIGHAHSGCVKPPRSNANYAYFRVGSVLTSDGTEIATGRITLETRHALGTLNATQTLAHYEDTGRAVADVAAGEDRHGIWIAGALRPGVSERQIRALRGSPLSGDWRRIAGNLELVAALAVNVPGFPIPRPSGLVASGRVQSLVASGMVPPRKVARPGTPNALSDDDLRYLKALAARERKNEADQMALRVKKSQLAMRRKNFRLVSF